MAREWAEVRQEIEAKRQEALTLSLGQVTCPDGRHDLIFDGEPQPVEDWYRCSKCKAEV